MKKKSCYLCEHSKAAPLFSMYERKCLVKEKNIFLAQSEAMICKYYKEKNKKS